MLDREGSFDRKIRSQLRGVSHTQERPNRSRKVENTITGSSDIETPTSSVVKPTPPDDEDSVTGKPRFGHRLEHDTLTSPQNQSRKLTSRHSHIP